MSNKHKQNNNTPDPVRARQKAALIHQLSSGASRARACRAAGVARRTLYNWIDQSADFRDRVQDAELEAVSLVESCALRCALKAEEDPRYIRAMALYLRHKAGWGDRPANEPKLPSRSSYETPDRDAALVDAIIREMAAQDAAAAASAPPHETQMAPHAQIPVHLGKQEVPPSTSSQREIPATPTLVSTPEADVRSVQPVPSDEADAEPDADADAEMARLWELAHEFIESKGKSVHAAPPRAADNSQSTPISNPGAHSRPPQMREGTTNPAAHKATGKALT